MALSARALPGPCLPPGKGITQPYKMGFWQEGAMRQGGRLKVLSLLVVALALALALQP